MSSKIENESSPDFDLADFGLDLGEFEGGSVAAKPGGANDGGSVESTRQALIVSLLQRVCGRVDATPTTFLRTLANLVQRGIVTDSALSSVMSPAAQGMRRAPSISNFMDTKTVDQDKGRFASDFEVHRELGSGGFGAVFHAKHKLDGRDYAVKCIEFEHEGMETLVERKVMREIAALSTLHHDHIVRYYSAWCEPLWDVLNDDKADEESQSEPELTQDETRKMQRRMSPPKFEPLSESSLRPAVGFSFVQEEQEEDTTNEGEEEEEAGANESTDESFDGKRNDDDDDYGFSDFDDRDEPASATPRDLLYVIRNASRDKTPEPAKPQVKIPPLKMPSPQHSSVRLEWLERTPELSAMSSPDTHHQHLSPNLMPLSLDPSVQVLSPAEKDAMGRRLFSFEKSITSGDASPSVLEHLQGGSTTVDTTSDRIDNFSDRTDGYGDGDGDNDGDDTSDDGFALVRTRERTGALQRQAELEMSKMRYRVALYIQMQLCGCGTLRNWCDEPTRKTLHSMPVAISIFAQVLKAVAHVHQHNLVHRDIKPSNVFLSDTDGIKHNTDTGNSDNSSKNDESHKFCTTRKLHVRLGDFGLAKPVEFHEKRSGGVGTRMYAAPEQLEGHPATPESDMFSVGLLLAESLMPPFRTGMRRAEALIELRKNNLPQELLEDPSIPPELLDVVLELTSADAALRPDAQELLIRPTLASIFRSVEAYLSAVSNMELRAQLPAAFKGSQNSHVNIGTILPRRRRLKLSRRGSANDLQRELKRKGSRREALQVRKALEADSKNFLSMEVTRLRNELQLRDNLIAVLRQTVLRENEENERLKRLLREHNIDPSTGSD